jgi:Uma2 family endonuclease
MADNEPNLEQMVSLILQLKQPLEPQGHHVGGNLLMYYDPSDGHKHLAPDVFVALDAGPALRSSWKTWVEGKFPEVVFEVALPSTQNRDIGEKVRLYTELGAREYYIFDLSGALEPAFRGYQLRQRRVALLPNPTGSSIVSPLLGLELRVVDGWLRVIDPGHDAPYPLLAETLAQMRSALQRAGEERAARLAAEERAAREAQARQAAEERAAREATARLAAEEHAAREASARNEAEAARQAAEERVARLEAELRTARARPADQS